MKKIIIALLMCCPLMCAAQSEWEAPVTKKNNETKDTKKILQNTAIKLW